MNAEATWNCVPPELGSLNSACWICIRTRARERQHIVMQGPTRTRMRRVAVAVALLCAVTVCSARTEQCGIYPDVKFWVRTFNQVKFNGSVVWLSPPPGPRPPWFD